MRDCGFFIVDGLLWKMWLRPVPHHSRLFVIYDVRNREFLQAWLKFAMVVGGAWPLPLGHLEFPPFELREGWGTFSC